MLLMRMFTCFFEGSRAVQVEQVDEEAKAVAERKVAMLPMVRSIVGAAQVRVETQEMAAGMELGGKVELGGKAQTFIWWAPAE